MAQTEQPTQKPLIILTGPTAVGKTSLSIALAKAVNGAIISADSMQVYQHMDIGTAKIKPEEMDGVPHFLIDEFLPDEEFHVVRFQEYAKRYMERIYQMGKIPILVGGTGFYIQAILYDIDFTESGEESDCRARLSRLAEENGAQFLHQQLWDVDQKAAEQIHPNNIKRVIRALEFYHQTGQKISEHNEEQRQKRSPYQFAYFVLNDDRQKLYDRINRRVDQMEEDGLTAEVYSLKELGYSRDLVSMQGLGYKEIYSYLEGESTKEEAFEILKRDTRHFAKRQLTWFKREQDVIWIEKEAYHYQEEEMLSAMLLMLKERQIL